MEIAHSLTLLCLGIFIREQLECPRKFKRLYISDLSESSTLIDKDRSREKILEFPNQRILVKEA
jgi:hypothetical protein